MRNLILFVILSIFAFSVQGATKWVDEKNVKQCDDRADDCLYYFTTDAANDPYIKFDYTLGLFVFSNDGTTEVPIGSGGGGASSNNLMECSDMECPTISDKWTNAAGVLTEETTASLVLFGDQSAKVALTAQTLDFKQNQTYLAHANQDIEASCWVKSSSALIEVCGLAADVEKSCVVYDASDEPKEVISRFVSTSTGQVGVKVKTTGAETDDVYIDNCEVGPTKFRIASPVSDTIDFSSEVTSGLVGFGTPTNVDATYQIKGDKIRVDIKFTSGTSTPTEAQIPIPSGYTIKTGQPIKAKGVYFRSASSACSGGSILATGGDTYLNMSACETFSGSAAASLTPRNASQVESSGNDISLWAEFEVDELSSTTNYLTANQNILTAWEECTLGANSWSANSTSNCKVKRVGEEKLYQINVVLDSAPAATNLTIDLPAGDVVDETSSLFIVGGAQPSAMWVANAIDSGNNTFPLRVGYVDSNTIEVRPGNAGSTYVLASGDVTNLIPFSFAAADRVEIFYRVPIVGLSAIGHMTARIGNSQSVLYTGHAGYGSTNTKIPYFSNLSDSQGSSVFTATNDSTNGFSATLLVDAICSMSWSAKASGAVFLNTGVSLNSSELTTAVESITAADRLAESTSCNTTGCATNALASLVFSSGDVVRPHGNALGTGTNSSLNFSCKEL